MHRLKIMPNKKKQSRGKKQGKNGYTFSAPFFLLAFFGIILVSTSLWFILDGVNGAPEEIVTEPIDFNVEYNGERHPLSGARVDEKENYRLFAVMVDNSQDAWPLSGIEDSFLVYEAPVEGNITRLMAMFSDEQDIREIGPVRSARPYYVDIALGLNALYSHVGGSPEALSLIDERGLFDLNEFRNGGLFWRSRTRFAPHNVYTETSRLVEGWDKVIGEYQKFEHLKFKDDDMSLERSDAHEVDVVFNGYGYDVKWVYDPEENVYVRFQDGREYKLRSGKGVAVKNVAILKTETSVIDDIGRQKITVVGVGDAVVLIDGDIVHGSWVKESRTDRLKFYDEDGDEIVWNVGKSWVQIVDKDKNAEL
jgi:hypothetical protein